MNQLGQGHHPSHRLLHPVWRYTLPLQYDGGIFTYYEDLYYQCKQARLPVYRAVFHTLLHVTDCGEWLGLMWSYVQWMMERMCGQ